MEQRTIIDMHAEYIWKLIDSTTGTVKQVIKCNNLILDSWINRLCGQTRVSNDGKPTIHVGTGTTPPSQTDTKLGSYLGYAVLTIANSKLLDNNTTEITYTGTFSETEVIGDLTEFGLAGNETSSTGQGVLRTRALITDSEGNPITIQKTSADILNVSVKLTVQLNPGTTGVTLVRISNLRAAVDADPTLAGTELVAHGNAQRAIAKPQTKYYAYSQLSGLLHVIAELTGTVRSTSYNMYYMLNSLPELSFLRFMTQYVGSNQGSTLVIKDTDYDNNSWSPWQGFVRWTTRLLASTEGNLANNHSALIKALFFERYGIWISFPNATLYPSKAMTFEFVGDGSTDEFSVEIPELESDGVVVSVDGVVQDPSTYTFSGKNFNLAQAWLSLDNRFVTNSGEYYASDGTSESTTNYSGVQLTFPQYVATTNRKVDTAEIHLRNRTWDFGVPVTVNTFANNLYYNRWNRDTYPVAILEYSTDGATWAEAARIELSYQSLETKTFEPITARYWRLSGTPLCVKNAWDGTLAQGKDAFTGVFCAFDNVQPWLKFNTAPASGAAIKVTAKCAYPMKNVHWRVDPIVMDIAVERGE